MSTATLPGTPAAKSGGGLKGITKRNPQLVVGAGAVGIVVLVALMSKKGAGGTGGAADTTATTGQINPSNGGYYDSTANDVYNSLMGQFQTLQAQVTALTPGASTPTPAPTPTPTHTTPTRLTPAQDWAARVAAWNKVPAARQLQIRQYAYVNSLAGRKAAWNRLTPAQKKAVQAKSKK